MTASTDGTLAVARNIAMAGRDSTIVVAHAQNKGLGAAYKSGLDAATRDHVMLIPGDDAWPESELEKIIRLMGNADVVIPYIVKAGDKGAARKLLSRVFTGTINLAFGQHVPYYNGVVIHRTDLIRNVVIKSDDFAYQVEGLLKVLGQGASYVTVATETNERPSGRSEALRLKNISRVLTTIARLFFEIRVAPLFRRRSIAINDGQHL